MKIIRVSQLVYIKDLLKEVNLTNCNAPIILIKAGLFMKINRLDDYNKANLRDYQQWIGKFISFACKMGPNITFVVRKLNKHNANPRKDYL